jgi:hypothetical protein
MLEKSAPIEDGSDNEEVEPKIGLVIESPVRSGYLALEPSNRTLTG